MLVGGSYLYLHSYYYQSIMKDLPSHIVITFLVLILSISLLLQPSDVTGTETPLRESPMMPPSSPTTPPPSTAQGQTQLPPLPVPTETKDKQGNTVMSINENEMFIQDSIPKDATTGEKQRARGYIVGYYLAVKHPDMAAHYVKKILAGDFSGFVPKDLLVGILVGVEAALPVHDLIRDVLEAIGVPLIPSTPQPPSAPIPKTPTGPDTPL
jgi:hypothetical protein